MRRYKIRKNKIRRKGRKVLLFFLGLWTAFLVMGGCSKEETKEEGKPQGILEMIRSLKGHVRVIGEEEYALYQEITRMMEQEGLSEEENREKTIEYAARINAIFYLGNRLELYEPFSMEVLKLRMDQENEKRREKLAKNEPVYGLQQFELRTFLQYELENLTSDIKAEILSKITEEELGEGPKEYYETHENEFRYLESVTYEAAQNGSSEIITRDRMELRSMRNSEPAFLDFINEAAEGDVYEEVSPEGEEISRKVIEIKYGALGYENNRENAVIAYMERVLFDSLIEAVANNNPIEIKEE
ncbi:MAG: hypothetical protein IKW28_05565 [Lachnospiraceae bacterium]|nr:hypothetical protein [Lachnospiraceae bacterium]